MFEEDLLESICLLTFRQDTLLLSFCRFWIWNLVLGKQRLTITTDASGKAHTVGEYKIEDGDLLIHGNLWGSKSQRLISLLSQTKNNLPNARKLYGSAQQWVATQEWKKWATFPMFLSWIWRMNEHKIWVFQKFLQWEICTSGVHCFLVFISPYHFAIWRLETLYILCFFEGGRKTQVSPLTAHLSSKETVSP